jgi:predicted DNA-binding protein with PD1-like motif
MGRQQEQAGCLISGIGSLSVARLRLAGRRQSTTLAGDLDILSLAGTLSPDGAHLHIAVADSSGAVIGGHLCAGSLVRTTAELVIRPAPDSDDHGESRCCRTARQVGWSSEPLVPFESPGRESARLSPDPCCR